ncbi:uncharacterized protein LOC127286237 [Leptopilina boulardi]|uniref:uncharacterized protein LOC127286237 n=1 Tax=Leptopilina boulardi TaxID=63433 RepID=UPI0021F599D9|nr:uncharacterized protein LOC127286237 [Leptopilina boulardi]
MHTLKLYISCIYKYKLILTLIRLQFKVWVSWGKWGQNPYFSQITRAVGSSWGLKPDMVQWLYRMVLLPRFLHAAIVWWIRSQWKTVKLKFEQLQAMALRGITGAMRTTPTSALGFLLAEEPLHILTVKNKLKYIITVHTCK